MTTSFTGVRQSKYITSFVDSPTLFLDVDLNEDLNLDIIKFANQATPKTQYSIGIKDDATADAPFAGLTVEQLTEVFGVDTLVASEDNVKEFNEIMAGAGIISNSQSMMFLSNVLTNSNNMSQLDKPWIKTNDDKMELYIVYEDVIDPNDPLKTIKKPKTYPGTGEKVYDPPGTITQNSFRPANEDIGLNEGSLAKKLGNFNPGDGYRYRQRGYLYINGKTQYKNLASEFIIKPFLASSDPQKAFKTAAQVWSITSKENDKDQDGPGKSCNEYATGTGAPIKGNSTAYARTVEICQLNGDMEKSFKTFEKVLSFYNVLSYDRV